MPLESSTEDTNAPEQELKPVAGAEAADPGQTSAESPPAEKKDEKSPASMLDAIKAAAKQGQAQSSGAETEGKDKPGDKDSAKQAKAGEDEDEPLGEVTDEELKGYHSKTRRRVKQLLGDIKARDEQIAAFQPRAESYDRLVGFVNDAGLTKDEVNQGFDVMKAMKQDPFKALEILQPYYEALLQATGTVLPADLQEKVKGGYMSEADARETARLRAQTSHQSQASQARSEQERRNAATEQQRAHGEQLSKAFSTWESEKAASDPDWKAKSKFVARELNALWAQGQVPKSVEDARKQADEVLKQVEKDLQVFRPAPREIRQPTGGASPSSAPAPTSTLEALKRVAGR